MKILMTVMMTMLMVSSAFACKEGEACSKADCQALGAAYGIEGGKDSGVCSKVNASEKETTNCTAVVDGNGKAGTAAGAGGADGVNGTKGKSE